jgi:hypothetical protein
MPLDIGLADSRPGPPSAAGPIVQFDDFENGGYYWYLHPWFDQLAQRTGQLIDLYGDAEFHGDALNSLEESLREARRAIAAQPDRWSVYVGTQTMPNAPEQPSRDVFKTVERTKFMALIDSLLAIVELAKKSGVAVVCFGD